MPPTIPNPARQAALRLRQDAARATLARLEAELDGAPFDPAADSPAWTLQRTLFRQRTAQHAARLLAFAERSDSARTMIALAEQGRAVLVQHLDLAREAEAMRAALYKIQSGSKLSLMDAQAARLHAEHALQDAVIQVHAARQAARSIATDADAYAASWQQDLLDLLIRTRAEADALDQDGATPGGV